jgi:riboflavin synthase
VFTGIVQKTGVVRDRFRDGEGWSLSIGCSGWNPGLEIGESIAVQGACLTVTAFTADSFTADLLDETMQCTALKNLERGSRVNLERALALGDRMGGHIVSGHVDETGVLRSVENRGRDYVLRIGCSPDLAGGSVMKGSLTVDGVSLTVSALGDDWMEVNIIPHTWQATTLCERRAGDAVNLEGDIIGKYIARLAGRGQTCGITEQMLRANGFG